jgi:hypothetical protein
MIDFLNNYQYFWLKTPILSLKFSAIEKHTAYANCFGAKICSAGVVLHD